MIEEKSFFSTGCYDSALKMGKKVPYKNMFMQLEWKAKITANLKIDRDSAIFPNFTF